jgi:hypothetical protein
MQISIKRVTPVAALFLVCSTAAMSALADPPEALDAISVDLGGFAVRPDINLGINTQYGSADSGDLTSHSIVIPRAHADFLLGDSQGFALDYYSFLRTYADTLKRNLDLGDTDVNVNAGASASVNLHVANAAYKWWFGQSKDVFGIGVGAAYYRVHLNAEVNTDATAIPGTTGNFTTVSDSSSATYDAHTVAPLIDAGWRHAFSSSVRMYLDTSGVDKSGGSAHGTIFNAALGAEWYFFKNIGAGLEYSATRVRIEDNHANANVDIKLNGPSVFIKARF